MPNYLVTGGAGFIGSNLVERLLDEGHYVRVLDNFSTGKRENLLQFSNNHKFELLEGDIRDLHYCQTACKDIDYVLHEAALGSVPRSIAEPINSNANNVDGTLNMLVAAKDAKIKRFVCASSSSVYGNPSDISPDTPRNEDMREGPLSPYAITKFAMELYARRFYSIYGLETVVLRYFNVFGRRQNPYSQYAAVIPLFVSKLLKDEPITIFGDGETSRDFSYVENVIHANLLACMAPKEAAGQVFNIACGQRVTLNQMYFKISQLLGKGIKPNYTNERAGDIKHSLANISKAQRVLGYMPLYQFSEGIEQTIEWYKTNL
jgi:UDP-N-acetylglucosamine/UDP-N-acetylgalactosamine 4-epimerase